VVIKRWLILCCELEVKFGEKRELGFRLTEKRGRKEQN
jgi:hypothetical protein